MRHVFISELVQELLGPRGGATEIFPEYDDPKNEYSTGQLFPPDAVQDRTPDEEEALANGSGNGEEDSDDTLTNFVNQAFIDAGQNFRRIPSSLGVSFVLASEPKASDISVCITWGRYRLEGKEWKRIPNYWITELSEEAINSGEVSPDRSLQVTYKISPVTSGQFKTSVYISSILAMSGPGRPSSEEIIFQPEIRILLRNPSQLVELGDLSFASDDEEWRISTRQYDKLKVYARGHLCGAYWKEIDPQRPYSGAINELGTPFRWVDGENFLGVEPRLSSFKVPHLRTDFVPMYPAPAPAISDAIELKADKIAEVESYDGLFEILSPLVKAYKSWISSLSSYAAESVDKEIVSRHVEAIQRIEKGLKFLEEDKEALVSFLFMNKAMSKQYGWGRKDSEKGMSWRPFQIAFILLALESTAKKSSSERHICDTIWFPTGGGKTEAYLGLAAFSLAYRRRTSARDDDGSCSGGGTGVISRYTLRLLTIQQFRRALKTIMACEVLRCTDFTSTSIGWRPEKFNLGSGLVWGHTPFSIGLWVGAGVTPNAMKGEGFRHIAAGAIPLLQRPAQNDESDPAQILECPCCSAVLSLPLDGLPAGDFTLRLHVSSFPTNSEEAKALASTAKIKVNSISHSFHPSRQTGFLKINLNLLAPVSANEIHRWWIESGELAFGTKLNSFSASRPGYVPVWGGKKGTITDYEIRCPEPSCELNKLNYRHKLPNRSGKWEFAEGHSLFSLPGANHITRGLKISGITVDDGIYASPPSMLISTVDKLARLSFTNKGASIFGRTRSYDQGVNGGFSQDVPSSRNKTSVKEFDPPSLIIQDELHLLDGPLGSSFGLFETAIEKLCDFPKYIASSATIRNSKEQIACLMGRTGSVFPPVNINISEGFFLRSQEIHPLDENSPGRLFLGLAFPGRAPQTPMLRIWGRLLQTAQDLLDKAESIESHDDKEKYLAHLDHFWTLIGYFNAVRELAQGEVLVRQDIPQFLDKLHRQNPSTKKRQDLLAGFKNLSSQTGSSELPGILAKMERSISQGDALSAVASTSMFGTGVDVTRLSLMVVHGQPKSASQYIQAVGRIGRRRSGLAVVFFRVSKPRDLNHYEYFTGYHRKLPIAVEPITVKPLAPKALDRTLGALLAILMRNWREKDPDVPVGMDLEENAGLISSASSELLKQLWTIFEKKWSDQPERRRPNFNQFITLVKSQVDKWQEYARKQGSQGQILPYTKGNIVLLGQSDGTPSVFPNTPQSLREVEATVNIYTEND